MIELKLGDCLEVLATMEDNSVDSIVTDPPYGISMMGKKWDYDVPSVDIWKQCLRVLKPGGHLLAFAGTRTQHRMCVNIEDAGFEIRDMIAWIYGQGFPKGINVVNQMIKGLECQLLANAQLVAQSSKSLLVASPEGKEPIAVALAQILPEAVPALITATGKEVGLCVLTDTLLSELEARIGLSMTCSWKSSWGDHWKEVSRFITETETEVTTDLKTWNWLTGLRTSQSTTHQSVTLSNGSRWPAVTVGQSLTSESKSLKSIPIATALGSATWNPAKRFRGFNGALKPALEPITVARKPLQAKTVAQNVLEHGTGGINIDGCRVEAEDLEALQKNWDRVQSQSQGIASTGLAAVDLSDRAPTGRWPANLIHDGSDEVMQLFPHTTSGKPSGVRGASKHNVAYADVAIGSELTGFGDSGSAARFFYAPKCSKKDRDGSTHPTMKPTDLMAYLCRLVTPPEGVVLDPFMGSGSTGKAAAREGFSFIGIEREDEYHAIAMDRIMKELTA